MTEKPVSTPLVKKDFDPITPAAAAVMTKEEFVDANTPRESSGANSPPSPHTGLVYGPRKRKYEEATEDEKHALNAYHLSNPHLKQVNNSLILNSSIHLPINQSIQPARLCRDSSTLSLPPSGRTTPSLPSPLLPV